MPLVAELSWGGFRGLPRRSCLGNLLVMVVTVRSLSAASPTA